MNIIQVLLPFVVSIFNAIGPSVIDLIKQAMAHPALDDNGKAAISALGLELSDDEKTVDAVPPLDIPSPAPTKPD